MIEGVVMPWWQYATAIDCVDNLCATHDHCDSEIGFLVEIGGFDRAASEISTGYGVNWCMQSWLVEEINEPFR